MVDPCDYARPGRPTGGSSVKDAIEKGAAPAKAAARAGRWQRAGRRGGTPEPARTRR